MKRVEASYLCDLLEIANYLLFLDVQHFRKVTAVGLTNQNDERSLLHGFYGWQRHIC